MTPRAEVRDSPPDEPFVLNETPQGEGEGEAPGTPQASEFADLERSGVEGSPEMDRSCPAGLANALALEGEGLGHVSTVLEASVIGQNIPPSEVPAAADLPMDISDPTSSPERPDNGEQEQSQSLREEDVDVSASSSAEASLSASAKEDTPAKASAAAVDVSDMPDAAPEPADTAAEAPITAA